MVYLILIIILLIIIIGIIIFKIFKDIVSTVLSIGIILVIIIALFGYFIYLLFFSIENHRCCRVVPQEEQDSTSFGQQPLSFIAFPPGIHRCDTMAYPRLPTHIHTSHNLFQTSFFVICALIPTDGEYELMMLNTKTSDEDSSDAEGKALRGNE